MIHALFRSSKARFWPLVDFIFLCQTKPARHAERIWHSKVSVVTNKRITKCQLMGCGDDWSCGVKLSLLFGLQEQHLHSGQRSGDLRRQGNGFEQKTQCKQRQRKVRNIDPSTYFRLDSTPASPTCLLPSPPYMAPTWPLHGPHMAPTWPPQLVTHHLVHVTGDDDDDDGGCYFLVNAFCFLPTNSIFLLWPKV